MTDDYRQPTSEPHDGDYLDDDAVAIEWAQDILAYTVFELADSYYNTPGNEAGGLYHIVLDDGNLEDSAVTPVLRYLRDALSHDYRVGNLGRHRVEISHSGFAHGIVLHRFELGTRHRQGM